MKACVIVLLMALAANAAEPEKKVNTKEMWANVKNIFYNIKGKLTNPENIDMAKETTKEDLVALASGFQNTMTAIGNNIQLFAGKVQMVPEGKTVQSELTQLGQCGFEVLSSLSQPMSEVMGILATKAVKTAQQAKIPEKPPTEVVKTIEKAAEDAKDLAEKAKKARDDELAKQGKKQ